MALKLLPFLLFACAAWLAAGCKKDDPNALPAATQEGADKAGFLLDGQPWLPKASILSSSGKAVQALRYQTSFGKTVQLRLGRWYDNDVTALAFFIPGLKQPGTYPLNQLAAPILGSRNPSYGEYEIDYPKPNRYFLTGPTATGQLIITRFDTVAHVVAGTFEATVLEDGGTETHQITQGRFDLTF